MREDRPEQANPSDLSLNAFIGTLLLLHHKSSRDSSACISAFPLHCTGSCEIPNLDAANASC
jgi:hypothetical protein